LSGLRRRRPQWKSWLRLIHLLTFIS